MLGSSVEHIDSVVLGKEATGGDVEAIAAPVVANETICRVPFLLGHGDRRPQSRNEDAHQKETTQPLHATHPLSRRAPASTDGRLRAPTQHLIDVIIIAQKDTVLQLHDHP